MGILALLYEILAFEVLTEFILSLLYYQFLIEEKYMFSESREMSKESNQSSSADIPTRIWLQH